MASSQEQKQENKPLKLLHKSDAINTAVDAINEDEKQQTQNAITDLLNILFKMSLELNDHEIMNSKGHPLPFDSVNNMTRHLEILDNIIQTMKAKDLEFSDDKQDNENMLTTDDLKKRGINSMIDSHAKLCICGTILAKSNADDVYNGTGVFCDVCSQLCTTNVYHCSKGKIRGTEGCDARSGGDDA
eukprot:203745_1